MFKRKLVCALVTCSLVASPVSMAGGSVAGATEPTQILNNIELAVQTVKQARMVVEQISIALATAQTVVHGVRNLANLPQAAMDQMLAPYQSQINDLRALLGAVKGMKTAAESVRGLMDARLREAGSLKLDIRSYMQMEKQLADKRGGIYRQRMDQDIAAIDNLALRADQLRRIASQTKILTGNLQGIQLLNQQATLQAGELMEIKAALLSESADRNQENAAKEDDKKEKVDIMDATLQNARERSARDRQTRWTARDPWRVTWPGMEGATR